MANLIVYTLVLLAPAALAYGWYFYFSQLRGEPGRWRNLITLSSLVLVSLVLVMWLPMMLLVPSADLRTGVGVAHQAQWMVIRTKAALCALLVAFVLCFLGRPRLILPTVVACLGTAVLWFFSALPFD